MLELRPSCEHCDKVLAPSSTDAMICSYECTFCTSCVDDVLENVCPNCGGGFVPRPIRPHHEHCSGVFLGKHPATTEKTFNPVDAEKHEILRAKLNKVAPENR